MLELIWQFVFFMMVYGFQLLYLLVMIVCVPIIAYSLFKLICSEDKEEKK